MSTASFDVPRDVPRSAPRDASDSVSVDVSGDARPGESGDARPGESGDARPGESGGGAGADRAPAPGAYRDEDFPGCESFHLPASRLDSYEERLEFWDGATETAWKVCEPTSIQHEGPSRKLVQMATRFEILRGSRVVCYGSADLLRRDATGRKRWLVQADEVLYLHPDRVRLEGPGIDVDADPLPDVVLEVDHTTDVRRRKLGIYMESGFPEIWVLVPWEASARTPGLAIHVRRGEEYREEPSSRAFPGWRTEEIFRALTESPMPAVALRALERTALAMGERAGTKPEDDPLMRSHSARKWAQGHAAGHREGHAAGHREGHARGIGEGQARERVEVVVATLRARGIEMAADFAMDRTFLGTLSRDALMAAALACTDEADFRRRVGARGS